MRTKIGLGIAAALVIAFAPKARACDARGYDQEAADAGRAQTGACPTVVTFEGNGYRPVDYDLSPATSRPAIPAGEGPGAGSGEPEDGVVQDPAPRIAPDDAAFLRMVWSAP